MEFFLTYYQQKRLNSGFWGSCTSKGGRTRSRLTIPGLGYPRFSGSDLVPGDLATSLGTPRHHLFNQETSAKVGTLAWDHSSFPGFFPVLWTTPPSRCFHKTGRDSHTRAWLNCEFYLFMFDSKGWLLLNWLDRFKTAGSRKATEATRHTHHTPPQEVRIP